MNDDGQHGNDTADGQGAGIAHEDLGGIGIVPEETDEGTDRSGNEDNEFLGAGHVHDVQVLSELDVTRDVGQHPEGKADDG